MIEIRDKERLAEFFRRAPGLHFYSLGDLDDFFWPHTRWFARVEEGEIAAVVLLYTGGSLPVCLALSTEPLGALTALIEEVAPMLPARVYMHLSPGAEEAFAQTFTLDSKGEYLKMTLPGGVPVAVEGEAEWLDESHLPEITDFYAAAYPNNWFEPFMLATGCYAGMREGGRLVAISGVHVVSREFRVAALGNIATHPDFRGRGYARNATAAVCAKLAPQSDIIGLNVHPSNAAAVACYERLGFRRSAVYREYMAVRI